MNFQKYVLPVIVFCLMIPPPGYSQHPQPQAMEMRGVVGIQFSQREGGFYIYKVFSNSPAEKAGLKVGDILLQVEDKELAGLTMVDVMNLFNGKPGTQVEVMVKREAPEPLAIWINRVSPDDLLEASPEFREAFDQQAEVSDLIEEEEAIDLETRKIKAWLDYYNKAYGLHGVLLDKKFGEKVGAVLHEGILVLDVRLNAPAFKGGLEKWDLIYKIQGQSAKKYFETNDPPPESAEPVPLNVTLIGLTGETQKKI